MIIHRVEPGETITSIAERYQVLPERIIRDNQVVDPAHLVTGQTLVIQFPKEVHTVLPGETLLSIATDYQVSVNQLYRNNPSLQGLPLLFPGQTLVITYQGEKLGTLAVNGYAYPFIDEALLRQTLPYLSSLTLFTYGFTPTGQLVQLDDQALIQLARSYGVAPVMSLSTWTEEGIFSNELAHLLLTDPALQQSLIEHVLQNLQQKQYSGLDLDFEYILPEDRDAYSNFVADISQQLALYGFPVTVAVAPKTYDSQPGLLYEAHDYQALGQAADGLILMTYEWGYAYGPPMAVSPIESMRAVTDYAVSRVPVDKINLGVPNYGYDWPLPFVQGQTKATTIGNQQAIGIAGDHNAIIQYDQYSQAPYFFYYVQDLVEHEVWFDDAESIRVKLELASSYPLRGVSYWNMMRPFPQNWLVLNNLYEIERLLK